MLNELKPYKFELFLCTQMAILFGSLVVPLSLFEDVFAPIFFLLNLLAGGLILVAKNQMRSRTFFVLFLLLAIVISYYLDDRKGLALDSLQIGLLFLFYVIVTNEVIRQVWRAQLVNKTVIYGLISGYISLGFISFFICLIIEFNNPGSFQGNITEGRLIDNLMYYSYITMMTIGYGDILPVTALARKASILIGLIGQFYLVIITAIVVGKFVNTRYDD